MHPGRAKLSVPIQCQEKIKMKAKANTASRSRTRGSSKKDSSPERNDQTQTEQFLPESQVIPANFEEVANLGSWKWDLHTKKVTWSDGMFRLFGMEREDFDGNLERIIADRIHPEDMVAVNESKRRVLEEGIVGPMSFRIVLPAGTERTVWAQGKLLYNKKGQPRFLTGYMQDISERVRAENKILQLKRLYATLSQVNQVIMLARDRAGLFQAICDVAVKYGGFSPAWIGLVDENTGEVQPVAANGLNIEQWIHPVLNIKQGPVQNGLVVEAVNTAQVVTTEDIQTDERTSSLHSRIQDIPFHSLAAVPFRLRGRTIGILALISTQKGLFKDPEEISLLEEMAIDISFALDNIQNEDERKQAEDRLRQSEARYRLISENSADVIWVLDPLAGKFKYISPSVEKLRGYTPAEIMERPISESVTTESFQLISELMALYMPAFLARGLGSESFVTEVDQPCRDGSIVHTEVTTTTMFNQQGEVEIIGVSRDITERKRAEQTLRENEERLRLSLQAANQGLYDLNVQTGDAVVNREYAEMLGYDPGTFVETNARWVERLHPDDQAGAAKAYQDYVTGLRPDYRVEFRQKTQDGSWKWILSMGSVIEYDEAGNPLRMLGTHTDITERKRAEERLRVSEERYRNLVENMNDIVMEVDAEGKYCYLSPNFAATSEYSPEEELGESALRHIHPDDLPRVMQTLAQAFTSEQQSATYRVHKKNGEWRWLETVGKPHRASDGSMHLITVARDITERKQAEDALKRNEQVLRLFVEHSPASIAMFDREMRYIVASRRYLVDYRLGNQDLTGRSHYEVFPEIPEHWKEIHRRCLEGNVEKNVEDPFPREDGTQDWVHWEIRPWYEETGRVGGIILFSEVITERKQIQDDIRLLNVSLEQRVMERTMELSHANRAKDEFLANMSHELRTPLNAILGLSESLLEQRRGPLNTRQVESIELIASSGKHLLNLINDILEVSKIEAGKLQLHVDVISVKELCESSLNFIRELALRKLITVKFTCEESLTTLRADPQRIKQVLINLLTNAVKFTPEGGRVDLEVSANASQDRILISVTDTGIGIAAEDLKKLFIPFTQLDSSLARQYTGTGLGLSLVQKLTEAHGGCVQVESKVGQGSRFIVALPLNRDPDRINLEAGNMHLTGAGQNASIASDIFTKHLLVLLAEDNRVNSEMLQTYLESCSCSVLVAQNGEEVLQKVEGITPDIIVMDIQMPKMDGLETTLRLRKDARFAATPIIALTALVMPGDRERCFEAGVNEYLSKPVNLKTLLSVIQKLAGPKI
jgi:PAS domain S-box-containing protein